MIAVRARAVVVVVAVARRRHGRARAVARRAVVVVVVVVVARLRLDVVLVRLVVTRGPDPLGAAPVPATRDPVVAVHRRVVLGEHRRLLVVVVVANANARRGDVDRAAHDTRPLYVDRARSHDDS